MHQAVDYSMFRFMSVQGKSRYLHLFNNLQTRQAWFLKILGSISFFLERLSYSLLTIKW